MSTRVLHIHVTGPTDAADHETVTVGCNILVGLSDASAIADSIYAEIALKTLGIYKTSAQMNLAVTDAVKAHLHTSQGIPTGGYAASYVSGAYGLLGIL